jgi:hypothetical protein
MSNIEQMNTEYRSKLNVKCKRDKPYSFKMGAGGSVPENS